MKKLLLSIGLLLAPASAFAADNITITQGSGTTLKTKDVGAGVEESQVLLSDAAGLSILGVAGTANSNVITIQGIASGTAVSVSAASLPLPTGAATAANQTAVQGTPGSPPPSKGVYIGVTDGTNFQPLIAPIDLGDGVNGNNMVSVGNWGYNGTSWDRLQVDANKNLKTTTAIPTTIPFHALSAASNNCANVKSSAGTLWHVSITNTNTSGVMNLRFYNKATTPVPGTDSALVTHSWAVPIASAANVDGGLVVTFPAGESYSSGIGYCLTGAIADNDNTNATTGAQINGTYQ